MKVSWWALVVVLLVSIVGLQLYVISRPARLELRDVHSVVLKWPPRPIPAHNVSSGYVASWKSGGDVWITAVEVWMGNPSGIFWEGDVYVSLNDIGDFTSVDQVVVHYQLDKHAETSIPHQEFFPLGGQAYGFHVKPEDSLWVWFAFNNLSDQLTVAGDGYVIIYFLQA